MNRWLDSGPAPRYINQYWICEKCRQAMRRVWTVRGYWSEWFHITLSNTWACQRFWEKSNRVGDMNAEETARGRSDSASQTEQAKEVNAIGIDSEKTMVETVTDGDIAYWQRPHPRIVTGPITGHRP